jgi:glycosyltransferase involved in cell wall biosynthesis
MTARIDSLAPKPKSDSRHDRCGDAQDVSAGGRLGYLAKMFPRISETFILKEVLALRREGVPVKIYSTLPPTRDHRIQPAARALMPEVEILPPVTWNNTPRFLRALGEALRCDRTAALKAIGRYLRRPRARRFRQLWRAVYLAEALRRDRISHLHAAWAHTPASVARLACRLSAVPWSMAAHAKDIHLSSPASLGKKIRAARYTLTCTQWNVARLNEIVNSDAGEETPIHRPTIELHYHGVDTDYFHPAAADPAQRQPSAQACQPPLILSVGRLVPKKGYETLLRAARILRDRGLAFRLEIVGEGSERKRLLALIRELGLEDAVRLSGMLLLDEVRERYGQARCKVLASRITDQGDRDGIPNTLAEAMACGVPVVASDLPSIRELIPDPRCGLLVPPEDPHALAGALEEILTNDELHRALSRAGRQRVVEHFSARRHEQKTVERLRRSTGLERILYVSADRGVPVRGHKGASVHVRSLVKALRGHGIETIVVAARKGPREGPEVAARLIGAGSPEPVKGRVRRWTARRGGAPLEKAVLRLIDNLYIHRTLGRLAHTWKPDAVYERYALTAVAGSLLARRLRVPHILEVNAPLAEEEARYRELRLGALARWTERWLWRRADRLVVVSEELRLRARAAGVPAERILVMPNAVDQEYFHPGLDATGVRRELELNGHFTVGFSGTLKPWHGLHHLLEAAAAAGEALAGAHLLVIGDGPCREQLHQQAERLGLNDRITFVGSIDHDQVGIYLSACDVLVAPYGPVDRFWFSPLKVAEYLAVGRPVVASRIGQLGERLSASEAVVLVPPGDETVLARELSRLRADAAARERMAGAARRAEVWTWDRLVAQLLRETERVRRGKWRWSDDS